MKHCILANFTPEAKAQRAALLPRIRESAMHHRWKDEFTPLLEKKAIFDHES